MDKTRVYIATAKSRKIIKDAKIAEKNFNKHLSRVYSVGYTWIKQESISQQEKVER